MTLEWHHKEYGKIGYSEFWSDREGRGRFEKFTSGKRLIVRREFLLHYLRTSGLELLIEVRLHRSRPYNSGYKDGETYDRGTVRAFVLTADGKVKLNMDQILIEKGKALVAEFSEDRPNTLQKWMANYIVELMAAAESAATEQVAQAASDRCADLITKLWQIQTDEQATQLQHRLWNVQRLPSDDFDFALLNDALRNPPQPKRLSHESLIAIFRNVKKAESWLLQLLSIANELNEDIENETVQQYLEREKAPELVNKLTQIFAELEGIDITNKEDVHTRVVTALRRLHLLHTSLLWEPETNQE
jgi:hypothetical protein